MLLQVYSQAWWEVSVSWLGLTKVLADLISCIRRKAQEKGCLRNKAGDVFCTTVKEDANFIEPSFYKFLTVVEF